MMPVASPSLQLSPHPPAHTTDVAYPRAVASACSPHPTSVGHTASSQIDAASRPTPWGSDGRDGSTVSPSQSTIRPARPAVIQVTKRSGGGQNNVVHGLSVLPDVHGLECSAYRVWLSRVFHRPEKLLLCHVMCRPYPRRMILILLSLPLLVTLLVVQVVQLPAVVYKEE